MYPREQLRKVKYENRYGSRVLNMANGYFHQWGNFEFSSSDGDSYKVETKGIIEHEDGSILLIDPPRIKFVDKF
ncbi:MAG TPA: hypothetical protein VFW07_03130 [Parafilimonas sp.]|nr:hypothetical protein [Parafilimonas sp.]